MIQKGFKMNSLGNYLIITIMILFSTSAQAATISFSPSSTGVDLNTVFTLELIGTDFNSGSLDGGGININFNPDIINATKITINTTEWEFFSTEGVIDNLAGTINGISFNSFQSRTDELNFATIEFTSVGLGNSLLTLSEYSANPFATSGTLYTDIAFQSTLISVKAVPLPASIWLFFTGLVLLISKQRKHI